MVDFSGGAVMTMLGVVETTVIGLYLHLARHKADESRVEEVEDMAEAAIDKARSNERETARAHRRIEEEESHV